MSPPVPSQPSAPSPLPLATVLGIATFTGLIAGLVAGAIDAVWSWAPAHQFVPSLGARLRFVTYTALTDAAAGAAIGVLLGAALLLLSRATRLGDLVRFAWRDHAHRRAGSPADAVAGLSLVLAGLPCVALALAIAFKATLPFIANRHVMDLVVLVVMGATLGALAAAIPLAFVIARPIELALRAATRVPVLARPLSSVWAPFAALGAVIAVALAAWTIASWETARVLPLRAPAIAALAALLAIPSAPLARRAVEGLARLPRWPHRAAWVALAPLLVIAVLATGGSPAVIKAASAYTGLGGPIARALRHAFDRDHDGYSRFLGGGDCDDSDPTVHPGAPEIPDDGIDQNCVGGDAKTTKRTLADAAFAPVPPSVPADFDVLLITIDTTRADHLGTYGYARDTSPNLDKLGAEGTVFENGWAHAPSTRYSIPAILTGRLPLDVAYDTSVDGWPGLSLKANTIAKILQPLGFATGAITNYWYFDRSRHMDQGFAEYDNEDAKLHQGVAGAGPEQTHGSSSKEQTDKALSFVERHVGQRWFLWVHYYDPHYAYEPHSEVPSFGSDRMALYDGEIRFTDMHIGRLLDGLRAKGVFDTTVVVVTGDHGEGFGEHGVELHGYHLYSAQTKVPLIVRIPGLPPHRSKTPAGHVDIMPTLANLAGAAPTLDMMGRSLLDVLAGAPDRDRVIFQQLSYENEHEMRAGVSQQCHVIYNVSPDTSWEVYRLDRDPMETQDLSDDDDVCADTRHAVEHWYDSETIPPGAAEALLAAPPVIAAPLDVDYGNARLLSVELPPHARPGETIAVTWTWEARGAIEPGWKMFVHLEGPGKAFANGDHRPARPFEWWKSGQFIRYTTQITLARNAAAGHYTLWAGLFRGAERMHATAPHARVDSDAVSVGALEVGP